MGGVAFHLRRRLTPVEAVGTGGTLDIRGTDEARRRAAGIGDRLRYAHPAVLAEELGADSP